MVAIDIALTANLCSFDDLRYADTQYQCMTQRLYLLSATKTKNPKKSQRCSVTSMFFIFNMNRSVLLLLLSFFNSTRRRSNLNLIDTSKQSNSNFRGMNKSDQWFHIRIQTLKALKAKRVSLLQRHTAEIIMTNLCIFLL